jgi:beta-phosphoglucomutase-like phosphatase (HAD superfamily)
MDGALSQFALMRTGLLIDSERIYTEATNVFLASFGKGPLPPEIKAQLMGFWLDIPQLTLGRSGPHVTSHIFDTRLTC